MTTQRENGSNYPKVTVVVVPRESFNMFPEVVERIYRVTPPIFKMLVMEGHAPEPVLRRLRRIEAEQPTCRVVLSKKWLYPHEAVNQAIPLIDTEYAVFVDNDVEVEKGWLEALVACAEEEKVGCVHPIYLTTKIDDPNRKIHIAEGKLVREQRDGYVYLDSIAVHSGLKLSDYPDQNRKPSDFFEWHCVLFTKRLLDRVGPLDDLNISEHLDYTFRIQQAGGRVMLEPKAVVAYDYERIWKLRGVDREYLLYRWGVAKAEESLERFRRKWNLDPDSTARRLYWVKEHTGKVRSTYLAPRVINKLRRTVGVAPMPVVREAKPALKADEIQKAAVKSAQG